MGDLDIKLIALDMDGTLLNTAGKIPEENRKAIKAAQDKGVVVVISTGRSLHTSREHADSLELSSYLVTVNGSEIWDEKREIVQRTLMKTEHIQWMLDMTREHGTNFWAISTERNWHNEMPEDIHTSDWLKFGFFTDNDEARELIYKKLIESGEFEISNSTLRNIEVNPAGINKAEGLALVCERLGISMQNVMAVGDSLNDLAMIREAGLGVAMGNAQESLKENADWITSSNDENGVAMAINQWVLTKE